MNLDDKAQGDGSGRNTDFALILHPVLSRRQEREDELDEAAGLARSIGLEVMDVRPVRLDRPNPGALFGSGIRADVKDYIESNRPDIVIVNHNLTPVQQRNLEREWSCKVIDRTGLILEIFGARAQTREGQIQVELAALEYQRSRLVRSWTHLERQRGGAGFMGGPGETQLEIDRRIIGERIGRLKKDLEQVRRNRALQRRSRERVPFPIVALVGYTNAGKSTLFNTLTGADVFAEDLPFATLDPTMRKITLPSGQDVILSDTVGFISDLPTHLVAAFRATLEQVQYADGIIHVRDVSNTGHDAQKKDVIDILNDLGISYEEDHRIIEVLNKLDAISAEERADMINMAQYAEHPTIPISALKKEGLDMLLQAIDIITGRNRQRLVFEINYHDGEAIAWLYEHAHIQERMDTQQSVRLQVDIEPAVLGRFQDRFSYRPLASADAKEQRHGIQN